MSAATLLDRAKAADVTITATAAGTLDLYGPPEAIASLTPELRAHKAELLALLTAANESSIDAGDEATIRAWLASIGEHDKQIIGEVMQMCAVDPAALTYYLDRATEGRREAA
ncbi:hypothetical protein [Halochromatium roseum]|uniref:hypothetical protein n=1 Tax=Halochromatium roseum TaxID=391920 RepID=UPI001911C65E|nr:hypothetical protein [Halochromatium roseum]MBK5941428.1 hypothetical protein [Halochromatium roseum]